MTTEKKVAETEKGDLKARSTALAGRQAVRCPHGGWSKSSAPDGVEGYMFQQKGTSPGRNYSGRAAGKGNNEKE